MASIFCVFLVKIFANPNFLWYTRGEDRSRPPKKGKDCGPEADGRGALTPFARQEAGMKKEDFDKFAEDKLADFDAWLDRLEHFRVTDWEGMPDIELYMDQVVNYMDRQLEPLKMSPEERTLTPAMVNNYVKYRTIPKPNGKKYTKGHMGRLIPLCILKQTLPIPVIGSAIEDFRAILPGREAYDTFADVQNSALQKAVETLKSEDGGDNPGERINNLEIVAFKMAAEAAAYRIVAERILRTVTDLREGEKKMAEEERLAEEKQAEEARRRKEAEKKHAPREAARKGKEEPEKQAGEKTKE